MKTILITRALASAGKHVFVGCALMLTGVLAIAQVKPAAGFEIISRQPVAGGETGRMAINAGSNVVRVKPDTSAGKQVYRVAGQGFQATVPALSNADVATAGGRIWVYGDSAFRHSAPFAYASVYNAGGNLIKSLGLLGKKPYVAAVAANGSLAFAGNTAKEGKPVYALSLYDLNGNKRWSASLPGAWPTEVYIAPDHQYIAVSVFFPEAYTSKLLVYDATGKLLHTLRSSVTGAAFLTSKKMVVTTSQAWIIYDMNAGFRQVQAGALPGVTVGRNPVIAHPSADIFFTLSLGAAQQQVNLQAYDARTGTLLSQGEFASKGHLQPYRQLEIGREGNIQLSTENEVVTLRLK